MLHETCDDDLPPALLDLDELLRSTPPAAKRPDAFTRWNLPPQLKLARARIALKLGPLLPVWGVEEGRCSCHQRGKCASPGKHPATRHGSKDATEDEDRIERWLHAGHNVGLACRNVVVVDVDRRNDGFATLERLERTYGPLPDTPRAFTGGAGLHVFFALPPNVRLAKSAGRGVDIKAGPSDYVLVDPSCHRSGFNYSWDIYPDRDCETAPPPEWLLNLAVTCSRRNNREFKATGAVATCLVGLAFQRAGMVLAQREEKLFVQCPWAHLHSQRHGQNDSSTVVFAPSSGSPAGAFHCSHAHCAGRHARDALNALDVRHVTWAAAQAIRRGESIKAREPDAPDVTVGSSLPAAAAVREVGS